MKIRESIKVDISDFQGNPGSAFETAEKNKSVVHIVNEDGVAGVLMSKEQYEFTRDEIESLYEVIEELTL
ncbi:hypothetical protein GCM10007275_03190 [Jeotgalicoccus coquinae]|uniref:PHD/YefM family antitoxin component YafN of YafNO toxin-antitoxin module n=1 Tax=Jeotgalicoccus coquinae TaxID=709509 RepID=A0A6V7R935_9STAP|nr:hypothetical protein [Jeotgalicoccus coquinae]MBB6423016.1 PHD/YefM family antitoxin component YafN of YafNO toxin-antitoxin module [Jeotgalicoccus coquinae]GGE11355.1 hypothetical protein GCM10007275_03190 [Jeotgalicoccus coquinae]CAD2073518.1 hypothetical protein JEOCOQ751_00667 [Jeotgalicoccus coquinae]